MSNETGPKKPEWFEMTESEVDTPRPAPRMKSLPIAALLATGLILSAGAVFANISEEEPALAESVVATNSNMSNDTSSNQSPTQNSIATNKNSGTQTNNNMTNPTNNSNQGEIANPAAPSTGGMKVPTARNGEDDDHEFGENRHGERLNFPGRHHEEHEDEEEDDD